MLALQASDWAFMVTRGTAVPYALERHRGHVELLAAGAGGREGTGTSCATSRSTPTRSTSSRRSEG